MLRTRTLEYVHIDDICELFGLNMREFSFTDEQENGSFFYLPCNDHWIQDTIECIEDMEGTRYEVKYRNTLKLQNYVRNEMKQDGIEIYIAW
jgi:hypothetical protein